MTAKNENSPVSTQPHNFQSLPQSRMKVGYGIDPLGILAKAKKRLAEEMHLHDEEIKRRKFVILSTVSYHATKMKRSITFRVKNLRGNRVVNYDDVAKRIQELKVNEPKTFTRMYRLFGEDFDIILHLIQDQLKPRRAGGRCIIPPIIKLAVALRFLAGGSYLDLAFGYKIPRKNIHQFVFQVIAAIDNSTHPFLNNIISPIHRSQEDLIELEKGYAALSKNKLRGTVAAGDGIIIRMQRPTNKEAEGDVSSNFTRKGTYAYGLQAFCDSRCKFVMISSMLNASSFDNTSYRVTQLSKDIRSGKLHALYHVVLDEAYTCTPQEMSPYKGNKLCREQDIFNYYLSLNRQVIERAFGILYQRWGILWRPLRCSVKHRDQVVRVACKLHNVCVERFGKQESRTVYSNSVPQFPRENDHQVGNVYEIKWLRVPIKDTSKDYGQGYRSDREVCDHRHQWTEIIKNDRSLLRPATSRSYKLKKR